MNKHRLIIFSLLVAVFVPVLFFNGCASTKPKGHEEAVTGSSANIDELLGLVEEDTKKKSQENLGEDDVLKLLGVGEEAKPAAEESNINTSSQEDLQKKLQALENEKNATETQKNELKNKIDNQTKAIQTTSTYPVSNNKPPVTFKSRSFADRYQEALQTYRNRQFVSAIEKFENLLATDSNNSLSDNCQYWIGECYYGLGRYEEAIIAFEKVFSFSKSNKDDDAQLKLGLCQLRLNNKQKAKEEFQKLIDQFPTSEYVSVAKRFISQIQ
ncbi:hypothetical protein DRQ07_03375 [candidate division KSB1 bacterium]|nr:MAG: hypothetical protein DRQ07_03375 [candidate division KSB1 bacterium]